MPNTESITDSDALRVAVRILKSFEEYRDPNPADVTTLRQFSPDVPASCDIDELARDIIDIVRKRHPLKSDQP